MVMEEIFNILVAKHIAPNTFYVLYCISKSTKPHNFVQSSIEVTRLKSDGWLDDDLKLTEKSLTFIQEIFRQSSSGIRC